jgi:PAS domain S-box-containing protein
MNLRDRFRRLPLGRKLTLLVVVPTAVVQLVAGVALVWFQYAMFRREFERDLRAVARIVGENSTAAIAFDDAAAAGAILQSLRAKPYIVSAALVRPNGTVFARSGTAPETPAYLEGREEFTFRDWDARLILPVRHEGRQVASLDLTGDHRALSGGLLRLLAWLGLAVIAVAVVVALAISCRLQRFVSAPLLRLAGSAEAVAERGDYSIRAAEENTAELGVLTRAFNRMLGHIETQETALQRSRERLSSLVDAIDGIVWECRPESLEFTFVSRQAERILGFAPEQWLADAGFWAARLHPDDAARAQRQRREGIAQGEVYGCEYRMCAADGRVLWIRERGSVLRKDGGAMVVRGLLLDISGEKAAALELERLNREVARTARAAGMAEVATGVLHNVGNVLNSVGVSATLAMDALKESKLTNLRRAAGLLQERRGDLADFLAHDPKGRVLPDYLPTVAEQLLGERARVVQELTQLTRNIDHIKQIVAMQQNYATTAGVYERLDPTLIVEDALRMNAAAIERHRVEVVREYAAALPVVNVDRHLVLQILVNLIRNAKYALDAARSEGKRLIIRVEPLPDHGVAIRVQDNGIGIAPENLARIFSHGFTTKRDGHGFGLHSGANAARAMGGRLYAASAGPGQGATFTLELPVAAEPVPSAGGKAGHT